MIEPSEPQHREVPGRRPWIADSSLYRSGRPLRNRRWGLLPLSVVTACAALVVLVFVVSKVLGWL